jgi:hypothetical protein
MKHSSLKAKLTRAGDDPVKIVAAVEEAVEIWENEGWPDDWSRWQRALDDAYFKFRLSNDLTPDDEGILMQRFEEVANAF